MSAWKEEAKAIIAWCTAHGATVIGAAGDVSAFAHFVQSSPHVQRWWARVKLDEAANACVGDADDKRVVVVNKTFSTVLRAYDEHSSGNMKNGFMLVFCSKAGTGKSSCLRAFTSGKIDFLPDRAVYVDMENNVAKSKGSRRLAEELGFTSEIISEQAHHMVTDVLHALTGENIGPLKGMNDMYEEFLKTRFSVSSAAKSFGRMLKSFWQCGSAADIVDEEDTSKLDDDSNSISQVVTAPTESMLQDGSKGPVRHLEVKFPDEVSVDSFQSAEPYMAQANPIAMLCIDNIPEMDEDLENFFSILKERIWDYRHRVVVIASTRHTSTAEKLRKLNDNQKVTLAVGCYEGDPRSKDTDLVYNNFDWSRADMEEHLDLKFGNLCDNSDNPEACWAILSDAASHGHRHGTVRDAENRACARLSSQQGLASELNSL